MTETLESAVPADIEDLVDAVLKAACEQGVTLATAGSCTGGLVASIGRGPVRLECLRVALRMMRTALPDR